LAAVLDTSVVVAFMNRRDDDHVRVSAWMETAEEDLVTTPLVVAEIDHLVSYGGGPAVALAFYEDLASGAYVVEWWQEAMFEAVEAARSHQALGLELADASLLALAARLETARIATLDELHFRIVKPLTGQAAFVLLPADA
jgi:predicted nucleic acid-binding protein